MITTFPDTPLPFAQVHSLRLSYAFSLKAKAEVRPALQSISEMLYEGDMQGQLWFLLDSNKQVGLRDIG